MEQTTGEMPLSLQKIERAVKSSSVASNLDLLQPVWQAHVARAMRRVPEVHVEAGGEALYLGQLSPGCRACKAGTWDCVFTTVRCNLDCVFCYSPHAVPEDYAGSTFGATPQEMARNHAKTHITGISFSGGEPFVQAERLFDWVAWFTNHYPEMYYWVYTNGLLADPGRLQRLGALGVSEIRFNMAATGYDHPLVIEHVAAAARYIPNVTVEIPAIPEHAAKLLSCLAGWCALGVRFLNLHELIFEPGTNSASMPGARRAIVTEDGHCSEINPQSRALTLAVMERVQNEGLPLSVNDCSLQSKIRQLRGRRRSLAPLVQSPYERMIDDHAYKSYCMYRGTDEVSYIHPDDLDLVRGQYSDCQFVRLVRMAPLSLQDEKRWIALEPIDSRMVLGSL